MKPTQQNHSEHDNFHYIKTITVIRIQEQFVLLSSLLPHTRQAHFLLQLLHFFHFLRIILVYFFPKVHLVKWEVRFRRLNSKFTLLVWTPLQCSSYIEQDSEGNSAIQAASQHLFFQPRLQSAAEMEGSGTVLLTENNLFWGYWLSNSCSSKLSVQTAWGITVAWSSSQTGTFPRNLRGSHGSRPLPLSGHKPSKTQKKETKANLGLTNSYQFLTCLHREIFFIPAQSHRDIYYLALRTSNPNSIN